MLLIIAIMTIRDGGGGTHLYSLHSGAPETTEENIKEVRHAGTRAAAAQPVYQH